MTETPSSRVDRLRRQAFEEEAMALREAVFKHFQQQTAAELNNLRTTLKGELTDAVRDAIKATVTDQSVQDLVSKELTDPLVSGVAAIVAQELGERLRIEVQLAENRILASVRDEFSRNWTREASAALNTGIVNAISGVAVGVAEQLKSEVQKTEERILESVRSEFLERWTKEAKEALNKGIDRAKEEHSQNQTFVRRSKAFFRLLLMKVKAVRKWRRRKEVPVAKGTLPPLPRAGTTTQDDDRRFKWQIGGLSLALIALLYLGWKLLTFKPGDVTWNDDEAPLTSESSTTAPLTTEPVSVTTASPGPPVPADPLLTNWMKILEGAKNDLVRVPFTKELHRNELNALLDAHPFEQQFSCWFGGVAGERLEKMAGGFIQPHRRELDRTFAKCFSQVRGLDEPRLAIFAAQATVRTVVFSKFSDWRSFCTQEPRPMISDMSTVVADGMRGNRTYWIMNLYLKCKKEAELTIDESSNTPEYLFVTYLALQELQPQ